MRDTAVLLTCYNRKSLVQDAIRSVLEQDCDRWNLYILDDGSNDETRNAIHQACGVDTWDYVKAVAGGTVFANVDDRITWWRGPQRTMAERKSLISYSMTINVALNHLLRDEKYICYLPDDDHLYPEAVRSRAEYLDAHPDVHVVYGRMRSVQYGANGERNTWNSSGAPETGRHYPRPTGLRLQVGGGGKHCFFHAIDQAGELDPETNQLWVEEGYWEPGPLHYGVEGKIDHSQGMHRRECLQSCCPWGSEAYKRPNGIIEFWGEDNRYGVGDSAFYSVLAAAHEFIGLDAWCNVKKFHGLSDGVSSAEVRE